MRQCDLNVNEFIETGLCFNERIKKKTEYGAQVYMAANIQENLLKLQKEMFCSA